MSKHCLLQESGAVLRCDHCGKIQRVDLPMLLADYANLCIAFDRLHTQCKPGDPELTVEVKTA
jgi:hypothetical protein